MVTVNPALTLKWQDVVSKIQPGFRADLVVIKDSGGSPYRALIEATDPDVLLVAIDGEPLYGRVDWMGRLKPMDYEAVACPGIVRGLDITSQLFDKGDQSLADITSLLEDAMTFEFWIGNEQFPGLHAVPLTPIFTSCDADFFAAINESTNADLPFDLWETYYASQVLDSVGGVADWPHAEGTRADAVRSSRPGAGVVAGVASAAAACALGLIVAARFARRSRRGR